MVEKLLDLIIRLKKIFLKVEISGNEENEKFSELILVNADLNAHIIGLQNNVALLNKDHQEEKYDCDNFAFSFKARMDRKFHLNNVGLVVDYSGGHAYNCVIFSDGTAELFEPQSDTFVTNKIGSGMYTCTEGFIIL